MVKIKSKVIVILLIILVTILIYPRQKEIKVKQDNKEDIYLVFVSVMDDFVEETECENIYYNVPLSYELQDFIRDKCKKYEVNMETILSIMFVESNFNKEAKSKNNIGGNCSVGIMQLNNNYVNWFAELTDIKDFNINNVYHNIEGGIAVYKNYRDYWEQKGYKDKKLEIYTLNSFNMGTRGYRNYISRTKNIRRSYDRKILNYKEEELCEATNIKD